MARETTQPREKQQDGAAQPQASASPTRTQQNPQSDRERNITTNREQGSGDRTSSSVTRSRGGSTMAARGREGRADSPFTLMQRMAEDMDRLFDQFGFGRAGLGLTPTLGSVLDRDPFGGRSLVGDTGESLWSPQVEVRQKGDRLVIRADLPGVSKDDLHVDVQDDMLTIRGERREEREENEEGFYRSERRYGEFYRAIPLPEGIDADRCEASYQDGVLEISLPAPRQEERKGRKIQIR